MSNSYSDWFGRQVVLQIETKESLVPVRGMVVNESNNALRFRLDGGWEVDIYKEMILRVEADNYEVFQLCNFEAGNITPVAALTNAMPLLRWKGAFDRWWAKHFSWQLWSRTILYVGLAGSILFVFALRISTPRPIAHFVRFICGYLGLMFVAVSLGCGVWVLIDSTKTHSHIFSKWSKLLSSFVEWFRQPIDL